MYHKQKMWLDNIIHNIRGFCKELSEQSLNCHIKFTIILFYLPFAIFRPEFLNNILNPIAVCHSFTSRRYFYAIYRNLQCRIENMFLYQLVSEPWTGSKNNVLPSCTNQTGLRISLPDFLPLTLSVISDALFSLWWRSALDMTFFHVAYVRYGFQVLICMYECWPRLVHQDYSNSNVHPRWNNKNKDTCKYVIFRSWFQSLSIALLTNIAAFMAPLDVPATTSNKDRPLPVLELIFLYFRNFNLWHSYKGCDLV